LHFSALCQRQERPIIEKRRWQVLASMNELFNTAAFISAFNFEHEFFAVADRFFHRQTV